MTREFTGRHMLILMVAFFGIVIAVNIVMARMATTTFGGHVVENSYVASQKFNDWLAAADRQAALKWTAEIALDGKRRVIARFSRDRLPLAGHNVTGEAQHPLGRSAPIPLVFGLLEDGGLRARTPLPSGRWLIRLSVRHGNDTAKFEEAVQ